VRGEREHASEERRRVEIRRSDEPVCQCELIALFEIRQSLLSHHIKRLVEAGLLEVERRHRWAYYTASSETLKGLTSWLS